MNEKDQKSAQEKALMYQFMNAQMEEFARQGTILEQSMIELETADHALKEINSAHESSEILMPLGAGNYGYGTLSKKDKFMVEIGSELVKEMSLKEAQKILAEKKEDVEDAAKKLKMQIDRLKLSMDKIGMELQEYADKEKSEGTVHVD